MADRYVTKAFWADEWFSEQTTITVYEQEAQPEKTGLLNAQGEPLYRVPEKVRMGFHVRG